MIMEPGTVTRDSDKGSPSAPCSEKESLQALLSPEKRSIIAEHTVTIVEEAKAVI